jgi:glycosyltransferase involved in cell wall biosynthesis
MKILFLTPYPIGHAPSQRFRFEQYFGLLKKNGHIIRVQPFLKDSEYTQFIRKDRSFIKFWLVAVGFWNRFLLLFSIGDEDIVFIHREASPIGPPLFEWIISQLVRKKIIYDFDDAIWLTDRYDEHRFTHLLKWRQKVKTICRLSYKVSCGNNFLQHYASQFNSQVIYNPTTLDCEHRHNPDLFKVSKIREQVVIGWTGSHSTLKYLIVLEPVLKKIQHQFPFVSFLIIADYQPPIRVQKLAFIKWNESTEIEDLLKIDIGIMPLPNDEWAKGKCGFKALQYMALKIPAVVSPVGVNPAIIDHGVSGYLAGTDEEWFDYLTKLIIDSTLRTNMGIAGRKKVVEFYSVASNSPTFLSLFE